jgi:hypothetical protein
MLLSLDMTRLGILVRGQPYPGQKYKHGWIPVVGTLGDVDESVEAIAARVREAKGRGEPVYWRFQRHGLPEFSSGNAYSATWGSDFDEGDPSRYRNPEWAPGEYEKAPEWQREESGPEYLDADPGYSSVATAEDLRRYIADHAGVLDDTAGDAIVFTGRHVSTGFDGEPLVQPDAILGRMPWSRFVEAEKSGVWADAENG